MAELYYLLSQCSVDGVPRGSNWRWLLAMAIVDGDCRWQLAIFGFMQLGLVSSFRLFLRQKGCRSMGLVSRSGFQEIPGQLSSFFPIGNSQGGGFSR